MKCINHYDRPAVEACLHCGKFYCKECASQRTPCICDECIDRINAKAFEKLEIAYRKHSAPSKKKTNANLLLILGLVTFIVLSVVAVCRPNSHKE